ncbi:SMP-30/gluconolactonase/LRE family protein [Streptomonospora sp. S1-112]|uniref:SMP-30/gluconolactonase/LRE family protein n=1 Tax=Streptomonospora mangrovi TaxID=2883123 RepID=A0A9X3NPT6_9ACTN|nr:SMP-30/gluconolactonase/LRE family protein [Streptomonospora mangrovi]MDA0564470.1 SMP-30/gluconolactonase/LRE family protein [Streptomonospora mangrovi]
METPPETWTPDRFDLGEGLRWTRAGLLGVDILAGRLFALDPARPGPVRTLAQIDVPLGAVAPVRGAEDTYVAAAGTGVALLTVREGRAPGVEWLARPEEGAPTAMRMNDGCCDPAGRFWAGSMAYDGTPGAGALYRADPDGAVHRVLEGYTIPNGPAFSPDGRLMYLADSAEGRIDVFAVDAEGRPGGRRVFARLAEGSPDGMQVDDAGHLWTAVWGTGRVHRYTPEGALDRVVRLPAAQPASVCVVGEDRPHLFVATAAIGLEAPGRADGAVFRAAADAPARPAAEFGGAA